MSNLNYNETDPFPPQPPDFQLIYPYPQLGNVNIFESRAAAKYTALQARLERRFANGFTGLVSYTFQQTLTDLDSAASALPWVPELGYRPSRTFARTMAHRCSTGRTVWSRAGCMRCRSFNDRRDLLGKVAGGWTIGAIGTFQDGPALTPASYGVPFAGSHANLLGDPNLPRGERTIDRWFDVSQLANPAPGQLGNAGKGVIRGSGNNKWDVVISKFLNVAAGHRLEFRAELFNALNNPQFDDPVVTPGNNPVAGKIMSASDFGFTQTERVIQLGLKYSF